MLPSAFTVLLSLSTTLLPTVSGDSFTRHGKWNQYKPPDPEFNPLGLIFME
jgi:hypothetical protein